MSGNNHFDSIAEVFNKVWHFSDEYKDFVISHIHTDLDLQPSDILADIGGGTGTFTGRLAREANLSRAYCVEPSPAMCSEASKIAGIVPICADAHRFSAMEHPYSKLLLKEVIHHIDERERFWERSFERLPEGGKLLIITRPRKIDFPFFETLKAAFGANQPDHTLFENELRDASFQVCTQERTHTFTLPKESWFEMLRHRFMSDIAPFSDAQIEEGITEIDRRYPGDTIEIADRLIFITATK